MNLKLSITLTASLFLSRGLAQQVHPISKAPIDTNIFEKDGDGNTWPQLQGHQISADGRYFHYEINNDPSPGKKAEVLCSTDHKWQRSWVTADGFGHFSVDGRWFLFNARDTLYTYQMGTDEKLVFTDINRFEISPKENSRIAYLSKDKKLHFRDLSEGWEKIFPGISDFRFVSTGDLIYQTMSDSSLSRLMRYNPADQRGSSRELAEADLPFPVQRLVFNLDESAFAFVRQQKSKNTGAPVNELWLFTSDGKGQRLAGKSLNIPDSLYISDDVPILSADGRRLFIQLKRTSSAIPHPPLPASAVLVDVWRYRDVLGQSDQLQDPWGKDTKYPAVVNLVTGKVLIAGNDNRHFGNIPNSDSGRPLHYLLYSNALASDEYWWHKDRPTAVYLLNAETGMSLCLKDHIAYYPASKIPYESGQESSLEFCLSPSENYVLYFNPLKDGYYSYDIKMRRSFPISKGIPVKNMYSLNFADYSDDPKFQWPEGVVGWIKDNKGVLVSDKYDIWLLDLAGEYAPVNVTGGYGREHHIVFHLNGNRPSLDVVDAIDPDKALTLIGFNQRTKYQGFYQASLLKPGPLLKLSSGPYWYTGLEKAGDTWMVNRQSTDEAPNIYISKDLRTFTPMTFVKPQKDYNWITAELVNYKLPDGRPCQGILYKPENFDPKKKYPVIFYYYEKMSQELYQFQQPGLPSDVVNVPVYTNLGYLVFFADIWYKVGYPGTGALQSLTAAAASLSRRSYIDSKHMGLNGFSWGAYETYYVITHSTRFAAAVAGDGVTDVISGYGAGRGFGQASVPDFYEHSQNRIGATPWQRPDLYIKNSPVLQADKVRTPLLMQHNMNDGHVNFDQGMEMFSALRRLDKKVWLLQYDQGGHGTRLRKDEIDVMIREEQFFDYYLKGASAPKWMVEGIPAKDKGIDSGYELEPGREP